MNVVRCGHCAGAVGVIPGRDEPSCLFCGSSALERITDTFEPADGWLPFAVDEARADAAFRDFTRKGWFTPSALSAAHIELRRVLVPAWAWRGTLETCFTGLVGAATRSGKRPVAGRDVATWDQVLVPSSTTLTQAELTELGAFDEGSLAPWTPEATEVPWEASELTRSAARAAGVAEMTRRHAARLKSAGSLRTIEVASVPQSFEGRPVLLPIWIGVYRWKELPRRVLVHGRDGRVVGHRPIDPWKVGFAVAMVVAVVAFVAGIVMAAS